MSGFQERWVDGKTVLKIDMRKCFDTAREENELAHGMHEHRYVSAPKIVFTDGSALTFDTVQAESMAFVDVDYWPPCKYRLAEYSNLEKEKEE